MTYNGVMSHRKRLVRYRATRLRDALTDLGLRQDDVARWAGISPRRLRHDLTGRRTVHPSVADRIATAIGALLLSLFEPVAGPRSQPDAPTIATIRAAPK